MQGSVLDCESILALLKATPPLIEGYLDLPEQLQPNGFDLTLREVLRFTSAGAMGPTQSSVLRTEGCSPPIPTRILSQTEVIPFGVDGSLHLSPGPYLIAFNEVVNLPLHIMALGRPRSSLLRCGVAIHTAVWDAGYVGRSQALMVVYNARGYSVAKDTRLLQLVFLYLTQPVKEGYQGEFQRENM